MAKRPIKKLQKYCVVVSTPRYDNRDGYAGQSTQRQGCFRSKRRAEALAKRLNGDYQGESHAYITTPQGRDHPSPRPSPHQKRRSMRRGGSLPF